MVYDVKDKVVIITGGSMGIGAEVVRKLIQERAKHVAILDIAEKDGLQLQTELNSKYGENKVKFYKGDVTNDDQLYGLFDAVVKEHGYIDLLINNAGIMNDSLQSFKREINVNVTSLITASMKALGLMRTDEGGRGGTIINISSVAGLTQNPDMPIYWSTKSAVIQFSTCLGHENNYSRTGVRVVTICFGYTSTSLVCAGKLASFDKTAEAHFFQRIRVLPSQSVESAANGLLRAYKLGDSGSTWLVMTGKPPEDITGDVKTAYKFLSRRCYDY